MKFVSIAFAILVAGANFASSKTPLPEPPSDTYTPLGPCLYHDALWRLNGSTQWEGRAERIGSSSASLYYFITNGPSSSDSRNTCENRDKMQEYCNKKISCGGSSSGTISTANFWPK